MAKSVDERRNETSVVHICPDGSEDLSGVCHCHDEYEILYVVSGVGSYVVEGVEYFIRPRTVMFIPPLQYHFVKIEEGCEYERYAVKLSRSELSDDVLELLDGFGDFAAAFCTRDTLSDMTVAAFERLIAADSMAELDRTVYKKLLASELIVLLSIAQRASPTIDDGELGARVIRYINENITKNVSLDRLAKHFFVSKYYLCRAFKKHNGISIHGYVNQKRVMYAKQLIEEGENASVAAYKVGFGDYSAFYRAYVKILGTSPTAKGRE